jgi:hypothetical protein
MVSDSFRKTYDKETVNIFKVRDVIPPNTSSMDSKGYILSPKLENFANI